MTTLLGAELSQNSLPSSEDCIYLKLQCRDCELGECVFCSNGTVLLGKEGCTRQVHEEVAARFQHYMEEVVPF